MDEEEVDRQHARESAALDPLLPILAPLAPGPGEVLLTTTVESSAGSSAGRGLARYSVVPVGSEAALWGALRRHSLTVRLAGPQRQEALAGLLDQWLNALDLPLLDWDTAVTMTVPSRDPVYRLPLIERGFAPLLAVLARPRGRAMPADPVAVDVKRFDVRSADEADLPRLAELAAELQCFDADSGVVTRRQGTVRVLEDMVGGYLAGAPGWTWVAGPRTRPVGFLQIQTPAQAEWMSAMSIGGAATAYLGETFVSPEARGAGMGTALVAAAHARLDRADVPVTLLHAAVPNPFSMPFWARMGYRPLWMMWQRRPASGPVS